MSRNAKRRRHAYVAGTTAEQRSGTDMANSGVEWFWADTVSSQLTLKRRPTL